MRYRMEIDGLRAVAMVPVMLFHAGLGPFAGGFVGVDVFFVISGYLITSIILAERKAGTFGLAGFYERRARRILPALLLVVFACAPVAWVWLLPADLVEFAKSAVAANLMASNVFFRARAGYFTPAAEELPLLHTWSLAVEEQYYVLFPAVFLLLLKLHPRWLLPGVAIAALASLACAQWALAADPAAAFYLLPMRAWELLVGVALAIATRERPVDAAGVGAEIGALGGLALIGFGMFAYGRETSFPGLAAVPPVIGTALVILLAGPGTATGRVLGHRALVGLGLVSYGAYLWHFPLLAFARYRHAIEPPAPVMAALCAVSFLLAYASWRWLEVPARDRQRVPARNVIALCIAGAALAVGLGVATILARGFPDRVPEPVQALREMGPAHRKAIFEIGCDSARDELPRCRGGSPGAEPAVALWGDSHAAILAPELDRALAARGIAFARYTKNGCPAATGLKSSDGNGCERFSEAALRDILEGDAQTVVVASRWQLFAERAGFDNGEGGIEPQPARVADVNDSFDSAPAILKERVLRRFTESILQLVKSGRQVILVYPVPEAGWDVPSVLARRLWFGDRAAGDLSTRHDVFRERSAAAQRALDAVGEHPNLVRVRPASFLCDLREAGRCEVTRGGVPLYFDDDHLTAAGAGPVVDEIVRHIPQRGVQAIGFARQYPVHPVKFLVCSAAQMAELVDAPVSGTGG